MRADLIVLGAHGKTSPDAFWADRITPQVANQPYVPLLLASVGAAAMGR